MKRVVIVVCALCFCACEKRIIPTIRSKEELDRDAKNNIAKEFPYDGWFIGKGPLKF